MNGYKIVVTFPEDRGCLGLRDELDVALGLGFELKSPKAGVVAFEVAEGTNWEQILTNLDKFIAKHGGTKVVIIHPFGRDNILAVLERGALRE